MRKKKAISDAIRKVDHLPDTTPNRNSRSIVSKKATNQQGSETNNRDRNTENNRASFTVKKAERKHRIKENCYPIAIAFAVIEKILLGVEQYSKKGVPTKYTWIVYQLHFLYEITSNYQLIRSKETASFA